MTPWRSGLGNIKWSAFGVGGASPRMTRLQRFTSDGAKLIEEGGLTDSPVAFVELRQRGNGECVAPMLEGYAAALQRSF